MRPSSCRQRSHLMLILLQSVSVQLCGGHTELSVPAPSQRCQSRDCAGPNPYISYLFFCSCNKDLRTIERSPIVRMDTKKMEGEAELVSEWYFGQYSTDSQWQDHQVVVSRSCWLRQWVGPWHLTQWLAAHNKEYLQRHVLCLASDSVSVTGGQGCAASAV